MTQTHTDPQRLLAVADVLRPQARLDLALNADPLKDQFTIRSGQVLAVEGKEVWVTQTRPPVLRSMVGCEVEASFVAVGLDGQPVRWGWAGRIAAQMPDYQPNPDHDEKIPAVRLDVLGEGHLKRVNLRLHYRVARGLDGRVAVEKPSIWREGFIMDLSGGGLLVKLPPEATTMLAARHDLRFKCRVDDETREEVEINCAAEVVRLESGVSGQPLRAGLKFCELSAADGRRLQKALHFLMREERRITNLTLEAS